MWQVRELYALPDRSDRMLMWRRTYLRLRLGPRHPDPRQGAILNHCPSVVRPTPDLVANHVVSTSVPDAVAGWRSRREARDDPAVRGAGYLTGSGWRNTELPGRSAHRLPAGLPDGARLPDRCSPGTRRHSVIMTRTSTSLTSSAWSAAIPRGDPRPDPGVYSAAERIAGSAASSWPTPVRIRPPCRRRSCSPTKCSPRQLAILGARAWPESLDSFDKHTSGTGSSANPGGQGGRHPSAAPAG